MDSPNSARFRLASRGEIPAATAGRGAAGKRQEIPVAEQRGTVSDRFLHHPVMAERIARLFEAVPPGVVVDATVGGGGHARVILEANPMVAVVGLDQDPDALAASASLLEAFGDRVMLRRARFDSLVNVMSDLGLTSLSGAIFDLGVSSPQLDRGERGFSYRHDGPLDMRMDPDSDLTAADVVNGYGEGRLAEVIGTYGDERFATRIAHAIVSARPIETTAELAAIVRDAIPAPARRRGGHPAKRTFQAIRIEVNRELEVLGASIDDAIDVLAPGGRCAVLAYHSGEDRIVKDRFRYAATGGCTCPPGLPCVCDAVQTVRLLKQGAWTASDVEVAANPRAESARLRAVEKLP
jgi:16S rRNA (cytosine1402-N4)-methyltransferase